MARHVYSTSAVLAAILLACGRRFGPGPEPGCVLRTASVSIWRSSAFVFGGARVKLDFWVMITMWGCLREK